MTELVYRLNYADFDKIVLPKFKEAVLNTDKVFQKGYGNEQSNQYVRITNTRGKLRDEFIFHDGYAFLEIELFLKSNGTRGIIHRDIARDDVMPWGINYVVGGTSIMEYYDVTQLTPVKTQNGVTSINAAGGYSTFYTNKSGAGLTPIAKYIMEPGVYLINGDVPHVATGLQDRIVFSMRSPKDYNLDWVTVVGRFKQHILDW